MPSFQVKVTASGPLFDGKAPEVTHHVLKEALRQLGETGQSEIQQAAEGFDRSGRGGSGRAAAGVKLYERPYGYMIFGEMTRGQVWWPWLEGVSKRNATTRFRGYHTFRKEAAALRRKAGDVLERVLAEHIREIGGE